jgi:hypothetical protein
MNTSDDSWIRELLEPARRLQPTDAEIAAVRARATGARHASNRRLGAVTGPRRRPGLRTPHARRTLALAVAGALALATAAAAATGLLAVGSVFEGEGFYTDSQRVKETVVATGAAPKSGRWQMTTFESENGAECVKLTLLDAPEQRADRGAGKRSSGYCGAIAEVDALAHGGQAVAAKRGEVLLFGRASEQARAVALTGDGGLKVTTRTQPGPAGVPGSYWVLAAPPDLNRAQLAFLDETDKPIAGIDVSYRFSGPTAPVVVATGRAPFAGPWRMTAYQSTGSVVDGDAYEPEGLPCVSITLVDPRPDSAGASGGCGVRRHAPGFTIHGLTLPAVVGKPRVETLLFGHAPDRADAVELVTNSGPVAAKLYPGPAGVPGKFWLVAVRSEQIQHGGEVYWTDRTAGVRGPALEVGP